MRQARDIVSQTHTDSRAIWPCCKLHATIMSDYKIVVEKEKTYMFNYV